MTAVEERGLRFLGEPDEVRAQMIDALVRHDAATAEHGDRVSTLAQRLATRMGVGQEKLGLIAQAGLLHDIGKLTVPAELLRKRESLSLQEWPLIRKQVSAGSRILLGAGLSDVAMIVRSSHERWDGLGYPEGLSGHEIPLLSRIIFLTDAYDSMTRARAWAEPLTPSEAIAELRLHAGTQFDPGLVEPFIQLVGSAAGRRRFRRPGRFSAERGELGASRRELVAEPAGR